MNYIIGTSFGFHDSSAALLDEDANIIAVVDEERFSRIKHDNSFPSHCLDYLLSKYSINPDDIEKVCYYENPSLKLSRIAQQCANSSFRQFNKYFPSILSKYSRLDLSPQLQLSSYLGIPKNKIYISSHHISHLCSSLYTSGFTEGDFVTLDGVGEIDTGSVGSFFYSKEMQSYKILFQKKMEFPNSIGLFYTALTQYLGFEVNEGEYKVMGLAPYGKPLYTGLLKKVFSRYDGLNTVLNKKYFPFNTLANSSFTQEFVDLVGREPRRPEAHLELRSFSSADKNKSADYFYADMAASAQHIVQNLILQICSSQSSSDNLVCAGGVFYNSVANGLIASQSEHNNFYIYPAAGDSGNSLGSAFAYLYSSHKRFIPKPLETIYLGRSFSKEDTTKYLNAQCIPYLDMSLDDCWNYLSSALFNKKVIAVFNGSAEHGPRALGNRSIIASPLHTDMKDIVNAKIKFRELFRPFAPVSTCEESDKYFDIPSNRKVFEYMLATCQVNSQYKSKLPAVTHIDGSARLQIVSSSSNAFLYGLIKQFGKKSGVDVLLNTSFNVRGEPIVDSLHDALSTFYRTDIDYLYLNGCIVTKHLP